MEKPAKAENLYPVFLDFTALLPGIETTP